MSTLRRDDSAGAAWLGTYFNRVSASFFFFQAEDGIRDHCVTGVQTCALPISSWKISRRTVDPSEICGLMRKVIPTSLRSIVWKGFTAPVVGAATVAVVVKLPEIGRASCRERV